MTWAWTETAASVFLVACFLVAFGMGWKRSAPKQRTPESEAEVYDFEAHRLARAVERHPSGNVS